MQRQLLADWGITGLEGTLEYQLFDANNNALTTATSIGVHEYPTASGNYYVTITWDPTWTGVKVVWTDGIRLPVDEWIDSPLGLFTGTRSITLNFKDPFNNPVGNVNFTIVGIGSTISNANGIITINLNDGAYTIRPLSTDGNVWSDTIITVSQDQSFNIIANSQSPIVGQNLSLSSVADADTYFNSRLYASVWLVLDSNTKQLALNDATRRIDLLAYKGIKTDPTQLHEFPRTGLLMQGNQVDPTIVPSGILMAQYEIAFALIKGYDPEKDARSLMVSSRRYSSVGIAYDPRQVPDYIKWGIPSLIAWQNLLVYLDLEYTGTLTHHRVS